MKGTLAKQYFNFETYLIKKNSLHLKNSIKLIKQLKKTTKSHFLNSLNAPKRILPIQRLLGQILIVLLNLQKYLNKCFNYVEVSDPGFI